ncbi:MAG TPA: hypothetical protein VE270_02405 [Thermoleophilaceae bacterium]|nr:hypothetical protein [Thermoleophilaceae bacterium]
MPGRHRRVRHILGVAVVALLLGTAACGEPGDDRAFIPGEAAREGIAAELDGIDYEVFVTRELNTFDPEDEQYYRGPPAPPGSAYYGVFLRACALEHLERTVHTSTAIKVVDIRGQEYRPLPLEPDNPFAYRRESLGKGECFPNSASATSYGPTGGAILLFRIPVAETENRPFELEIEGEPPAPRRPPRVAHFELDL